MSHPKCPSPYDRVNIDEEDEMIIKGYIVSRIRMLICILIIILSCGTLLILFLWRPGLWVKCAYKRCSFDQAQKLILIDEYEEYIEKIHRPKQNVNMPGDCVHFYHKKIKYVWREELNQFVKLKGYESEKCGLLYSMSEGLSNPEANLKINLYGINSVNVEIKPIWKLIVEEILTPFYIYQMFIFTVWMIQLYYQFAICVLLLSVVSVSMHVWQTRKQAVALRKKVHSESDVLTIRDQNHVETLSTNLVPGDVIILPTFSDSFIMECDAVLISGTCTVDESMLSGESVPITKVSLSEDPNVYYSTFKNKHNTLFCGTQVLHVQSTDCTHVKAVVIRTGFSTAKGELVRTILFPKPADFKLKQEFIKSMIIFMVIGIPCMIYTAYCFGRLNVKFYDILIIVFDVATFLVPPLLPAILTSINAHAQRRIKKQGVFCLNPNFISACGGLDLVCFDKTGTLTQDSIDLSGVIPVNNHSFQTATREVSSLPIDNRLLLSMGACHSLTLHNGKVDGENLDLKLFEAINWEFKEDKFINDEIAFERYPERVVGPISNDQDNSTPVFGIIKQFPFESMLQRMLVIVKQSYNQEYIVIAKGAPEIVKSFCRSETIPNNFDMVLETYTRDGMRVIASASKLINTDLENCLHISREELEVNLEFDGFMVFQNCLKPETLPSLKILKEADIRSVMVTGDNILTAISVARNCGMISEQDSVIQVDATLFESPNGNKTLKVSYNYVKLPGFSEKLSMKQNGGLEEVLLPFIRHTGGYHLALEGKTFSLIRTNDPILLNKIIHKGSIFARMQPEQKLYLIEEFQKQGHQVGMCGDGANDCGALRIANAGISLSVAESSVAAPFTYKEKNICCVPLLIREGRATLTATFGAFKYQVSYCFILLGAVLILFWNGIKPSDGTYVLVDIVLNILPPMVFGTTEAYPHLVKQLPTRSIISFLPQFSMYSFIILQILLYLIIKYLVSIQVWYEPFVFNLPKTHQSEPSHLALAIFSVNMVSYIIAAIIFSPGPPYRKDIFSNSNSNQSLIQTNQLSNLELYIAVVFLNFALVSCIVLFPPNFILRYINFKDVPMSFKVVLFGISMVNFVVCYIWEIVFLQSIVCNILLPKLRKFRGPIHKFEKIEAEIAQSDSWPPLIGMNKPEKSIESRKIRKEPKNDLWIMRSTSNEDDEYPSFNISIPEDNDEYNNHNNQQIKFVTFSQEKSNKTHDKHEQNSSSCV